MPPGTAVESGRGLSLLLVLLLPEEPRSLQHLEPSVSPRVKGGDPGPCTREPGGISEQQNWQYLTICLSSLLEGNMQGQENPSLVGALEKKPVK